jgi:CYTH domain-containing protein
MQPKYSQPEIERRWLVNIINAPELSDARVREIEDKYLIGGRLRLRKISERNQAPTFKLCKKYVSAENSHQSVVNIYLTEGEYQSLIGLPGKSVAKTRYSVEGGALDVYDKPSHKVAIFEMEFENEQVATQYVAPSFVSQEVTLNEGYSGFALSGVAI